MIYHKKGCCRLLPFNEDKLHVNSNCDEKHLEKCALTSGDILDVMFYIAYVPSDNFCFFDQDS
jgi:hypothetical protein